MTKLGSWDELKKFREDNRKETSLLTSDSGKTVLAVGEATCGIAAGAKRVAEVLRKEIDKQGLENVSIIATGCFGYCYAEPMVEVREPGKKSVYYGYVTEDTAREIVSGHLLKGKPLTQNILNVEVWIP
ncbi:MAG: (2Fe-2S) ferredoxin domain-containing protein [Clostridiales bacterium]|jgi:NADP-reducing hydrogenase subunit HndB|nr:(2Fe-2S) ferredoxin domain-containing protein [Clostridiales bacterium]